jgi:hypothetical protein
LACEATALWLSLLSVLSRAKGSPNWVVTTRVGSFFAREYCPLERVLSHAASICAAIGVAIAIYVINPYGGFDLALDKLSAEIAPFVDRMMNPKVRKKISKLAAAVTQLANDAARGDKKAIQLAFALLQVLEPTIEAQRPREVIVYSGVLAEQDRHA